MPRLCNVDFDCLAMEDGAIERLFGVRSVVRIGKGNESIPFGTLADWVNNDGSMFERIRLRKVLGQAVGGCLSW